MDEPTVKQCLGALNAAKYKAAISSGWARVYWDELVFEWTRRLERARDIAHCSEVL